MPIRTSYTYLLPSLRLHNSQPSPNRHILLPPNLRKPAHLDSLPKQQTIGRTPKVKHARLVPLFQVIPLPHCNLTTAHLVHPDRNKRNQPKGRVIRFNEKNRPRRQRRDIPLRILDAFRVNLPALDGRLEQWLAEIRPVAHKTALDGAGDGGVPAVVGEGRQKGLVDGGAVELRGERVVAEHVEDRVGLALDPKLVAELGRAGDVVDFGLARVGNDGVVVGGGDGAGGGVDGAGEEV